MTAKTSKDAPEDVEGAAAEGRSGTDGETGARPARKKVRRVRVIEVIDDGEDGDLRDVLEALDREDEQAEQDEQDEQDEQAPAGAKRAPSPQDTPADEADTEPDADAEPEPAGTKPAESATEPAEPEQEPARSGKKTVRFRRKPAGDAPARGPSLSGLPAAPAVVAVVLIAALAVVSVVLWRSQHQLSQREEARREVIKVVTDYGNAVLSYDRTDLKNSVARAHSFLTGDALTKARQTDVERLQKSLDDNRFSLTSKTDQVYVGSVDGMFASAVLVFDITFQSPSGTQEVTRNYLSLSLVRQDGTWKISQQKAAGRESDDTTTGGDVPSPSGEQDGAGEPENTPKNTEESGRPKD